MPLAETLVANVALTFVEENFFESRPFPLKCAVAAPTNDVVFLYV